MDSTRKYLLNVYNEDQQFRHIVDNIIKNSDIEFASVEDFFDKASSDDVVLLQKNIELLKGNLTPYLNNIKEVN